MLGKWLKDQKIYLVVHSLLLLITVVFLLAFNMGIQSVLFLSVFYFLGHLAYLSYAYLRHFSYFVHVKDKSDSLDKKYLLHSCIEEPNFLEGQMLYDIVHEAHGSMSQKIHQYHQDQKDYKAYIEAWVHEIKTPIASLTLLEDQLDAGVKDAIDQIEAYVDQSLYYAKSHHIEKDYYIRSVNLKTLVGDALKAFSRPLIHHKCQVVLEGLDLEVMSDGKWMAFILSQLIKNSIQYRTDPMILTFKAQKGPDCIDLWVEDNGLGIHGNDLAHIFDKGFTGSKGRSNEKATGIGLYLCKTLCEKMGLSISCQSQVKRGTSFKISFPYKDILED